MGVGYLAKPYQSPRPEIVGTVVAPFSKGVIAMGRRDFHPLSANFLLSKWLKSHWDNYALGKSEVGQRADPADWRVARTIFVSEDEKVAQDYGRDNANSPYRFYYNQMLGKLSRSKRQGVFKTHRDQPDSEVTLDNVLDNLVICGTVDSVVDQILAMHAEIGDFGELVYAGLDWADKDLSIKSMELMANKVMPKVREAIGQKGK
jgi:alkanesulfonate monooxygenase SsuD/methylene tetrahydromethanopterin reductase-like flavin-dependent oxidoreductase (luciferase family)